MSVLKGCPSFNVTLGLGSPLGARIFHLPREKGVLFMAV
jgi:hypothetical protein